MITLITGVPGSSKTLNAIHMVTSDPQYVNRPVYQYNIKGLTLDWNELSKDEAEKWYELPHGSVVVLDECQDLFPPMKYGDKAPKHIQQLNTHRHLGIDIILITQHPKLLDTKVRRLVGRHLHYKRQFGMESATCFQFEEVADDPNDYFTQKKAQKSRKKFPKKLYGCYKSAEVHTHKRRLPKMLFILPLAMFGVGYVFYAVASSVETGFGANSPGSVIQDPTTIDAATDGTVLGSEDAETLTREEYIAQRERRIPYLPHSAPIYDDVYEVKDFPRPQCMVRESVGQCTCYTQQATPLPMDEGRCLAIVKHGYWDPTRDPASGRSAGERSSGDGRGSSSDSSESSVPSALARYQKALQIRYEIAEMNW